MHVLLRCDATDQGGIGHVVRATSVAQAAREAGYSVTVAGTIESAFAAEVLNNAGIDVVPADDDLGVLAAEHGASVVHIDDYPTGVDAWRQLHTCGAAVSSMEDGTYGRRPADVVVDSTIGAELTQRPDDGSGLILRGIQYAPMRQAVIDARERRAHRSIERAGAPIEHDQSDPLRVLIVMGGTDATGAAGLLASLCSSVHRTGERPLRITVIAPDANRDRIRELAGPEVKVIAPTPAFLDLAADMDAVISASGTTAWELACIGVPTVLVAVVDNQRAGYDAALAAGIAHGLGTVDAIRNDPQGAEQRLRTILDSIAHGPANNPVARERVDGHGAARIVSAWQDHFSSRLNCANTPALGKENGVNPRHSEQRIMARDAEPDDSLHLLRWRNDPTTRAVSRSHDRINATDHIPWFLTVLERDDRELYVVECAGIRVGTVRFDALHANRPSEWEVSINLAPEARGRGLAGAVLGAGEALLARRYPQAQALAFVHPENAPSVRIFEKAGYQLAEDRRDGDFEAFVKTPL